MKNPLLLFPKLSGLGQLTRFGPLAGILCIPSFAQVFDAVWRTDINGGFGNWNNAAQWSPAVVPNNAGSVTYNVSLGGNVGTTLTSDVTIDRLDVTGGQILGAGSALTINNQLNVNLSSFAQLGLDTLNLAAGSVSTWIGGDITVNSTATVLNFGSFTVTASSPVTLDLPVGASRSLPAFVNEPGATFTKGSASQLTLNVPFQNAGTVEHGQGTIFYQSGGLRQLSGEYHLGPTATASGDLQASGGTIRAAGTFDPFGVMQVVGTSFIIGLDPNATRNLSLNNKQLSFSGGTLEFKIESGISYDRIQNLAGWSVNGTTLSLRLINNAQSALQASDILTLANGNFDNGMSFGNVPNGGRLSTTDGLGSFVVNYPPGSGDLILTDFQPVPEPRYIAIATTMALAAFAFSRRNALKKNKKNKILKNRIALHLIRRLE